MPGFKWCSSVCDWAQATGHTWYQDGIAEMWGKLAGLGKIEPEVHELIHLSHAVWGQIDNTRGLCHEGSYVVLHLVAGMQGLGTGAR